MLASWQAGFGPGALLHRRGRRKKHRPDCRVEERGRFFRLARALDGRTSRKGSATDVVATQELSNGVCRVDLHLDPERETTPFSPAAGTDHAVGASRRDRRRPKDAA